MMITLSSKKRTRNLISYIKTPSFLLAILFELGLNIRYRDIEMLRLLIKDCNYYINKSLLRKLLAGKPTIILLDNALFYIEDLEDLYHSTLCYEKDTLKLAKRLLSPGGVFVDVGANIGGYTIRLASKARRVYSFEPHPRNFRLLKYNLKLNNLYSKVYAYRYAVSQKKGKVLLTLSEFHGRHSIVELRSRYIEVPSITLDDILYSEDNIDVIKIDVEGAEPLVLLGAKNTLTKTKYVIIETTFPVLRDFSHKILKKLGFQYLGKTDKTNSIYYNTKLLQK